VEACGRITLKESCSLRQQVGREDELNTVLKGLKKKICSIEICAAAAAAVILACTLWVSPITGVANNGDYGRIMTPAGLGFITNSRFVNLDRYFKIGKQDFVFRPGKSYISSHLLPVLGAIRLNERVFSREILDIRFLGVVYSGIFILGLYLLARNGKTGRRGPDLFYGALLVLILCDTGYVAYFNSFLGEAAILAFFLLMMGILPTVVKGRRISAAAVLCFSVSAVLFIAAKQSNVPLGIFIALFVLSLLLVDRRRGIIITVCISAVLLLGSTFFLYFSAPDSMERITRHQTVFYGILKDSPTPEEDLEFMGLPKSLAVLKEASYYDSGLPIASDSELLEKEFYSKINFGTVLKFYLYHPSRFLEKLEVTARNSMMIRPPYLGNFTFEDTGERLGFSRVFSLWSTFKKTYMPASLLFVAVFFFSYLFALFYQYGKALKAKEWPGVLRLNGFLLLWLMGAAQFAIPVLGDGEVDLAKHMFGFNLCFDMMLISAAVWTLSKGATLLGKIKRKAGLERAIWVDLILLCVFTVMLTADSAGRGGGRQSGNAGGGSEGPARISANRPAAEKIEMVLADGPATGEAVRISADGLATKGAEGASPNGLSKEGVAGAEGVPGVPEISSGKPAEVGIGSYLKFGRYGGEELVWQVIYKDQQGWLMLLADKIIGFKAFDAASDRNANPERRTFGSNCWGTSTLRTWLNSADKTVNYGLWPPNAANVWEGRNSYGEEPGFLYGFTEEERKAIKTTSHRSILSTFDMKLKDGGETYYFWTNSIPLLVQNYDAAYYQITEDKVFLPDVKELKEYVYDNRLKCKRLPTVHAAKSPGVGADRYSDYWLRTPYATRPSFVRYVGSDGYVYHKDAYYGNMGVLPILCIDGPGSG
jgi:hypothetical protein